MYPRLGDIVRAAFGVEPPLPLYSFGTMVALAVVTASWLSRQEFARMCATGQLDSGNGIPNRTEGSESSRNHNPTSLALALTILATAGGVAGGMLPWVVGDRPLGFPLGPLGTFYGGLMAGGAAIATYVRLKHLSLPRVADALAPSLMLAYGIGRIGCYLAGDGDWGTCSSLADKPRWIPAFLWSETFPRNIIGVDVLRETALAIEGNGLSADRCNAADGVFPTMLYETLIAFTAFAVLWRARRHTFKAGWLFSVYLVFNGLERFLIEVIRLNPRVWLGLTVAQIVAVALTALGLSGVGLTMHRGAGHAWSARGSNRGSSSLR